MGDWVECRLADVCSSIDYGHTASASDSAQGPRFLRITDIVPGHIDWSSVPTVEAGPDVQSKYRLDDGDIVLARTGASTGTSAYVSRPPAAVFASYLVRLKIKPTYDARYVAYFLKSEPFWTFIRGVLGDKSAQPNASASTMTGAPFRAPRSLAEQRRIAGILGALDDKIELNRWIAETLERLARAAYAELMADRRDDWPVRSIADVAFNPRDQVDPRQVDPATPYIALEHVPRGRMVLGEWGQAADAESTKMMFEQNDILFGKLRPYFHKVGVVSLSGICSTDIIVIRPKRAEDLGYVLAATTDPVFIDASNAASTGTRMPRTSWSDLVRFPLAIPPASARATFNKRLWPLIERAQVAIIESKTLEQLRDALLPRLLAGDLEVGA